MFKTAKELAFLRDLYIQNEWTQRFTELVDKFAKLEEAEDLLYLNAGTGGHVLALEERIGDDTNIFAVCGNEHELSIAADKALAVGSRVDFSTRSFSDSSFAAVVADLSLSTPIEYKALIDNVVSKAGAGGEVVFFLPTAGSFGELFSILWEAASDAKGRVSTIAEDLVSALPTVTAVVRAAESAGLVNVSTETVNEVFDFETGDDLIGAPLVEDFLFPMWFERCDDDETGRIKERLAGLINDEFGDLSFQFSIKATLVRGQKA